MDVPQVLLKSRAMKSPVLTTILIASAAVLLPVLIVSGFAGMGIRKASERQAGSSVVTVHPHEGERRSGRVRRQDHGIPAGTIDMGSGEDWQARADSLFAALPDGDFLLFNPRQEHWDAGRPGEMDYQVNWELDHLEKADWIIMNFLPGSRSPITLLELGLHAASGRLLVICPPGFYRYDNVRITCGRYGVPMLDSLEDAVRHIGQNGSPRGIRRNFEYI